MRLAVIRHVGELGLGILLENMGQREELHVEGSLLGSGEKLPCGWVGGGLMVRLVISLLWRSLIKATLLLLLLSYAEEVVDALYVTEVIIIVVRDRFCTFLHTPDLIRVWWWLWAMRDLHDT